MESGNSGSMSSSGGDEEYDSRGGGDSLPSFLNTSAMAFAANSAPSLLSNDPFLFTAPNSSSSFLHMNPHPPPHSNAGAENPFLGFELLRSGSGGGSGRPGSSSFAVNFDDNIIVSSGQSNTNNVLSSPVPPPPAPRNPKKRTRASRRAPTTVLTTDTTNFRAMVQEFTGIPAPPFSGSSFSRRLDLFGGTVSGLRSGLESIGALYPIRPSSQKIQPSSSGFGSGQNVNNMVNIPNSVLTFQSLIQSQGNLSMPQPFVEVGHGGLNVSLDGLQSHIPERHNNNGYDEDHRSRPSSVNEKYGNSSQRVGNNCKLNYSASNTTSDFHQHDKGLDNVASRGEGTVDSWICPSD